MCEPGRELQRSRPRWTAVAESTHGLDHAGQAPVVGDVAADEVTLAHGSLNTFSVRRHPDLTPPVRPVSYFKWRTAMQAREFWRIVTVDRTEALDRVLACLRAGGARFCVISRTAVNAAVEPVVTLDLNIVIQRRGFFRTSRRDGADLMLPGYADRLRCPSPSP